MIINVIPLNDLNGHSKCIECECNPAVEMGEDKETIIIVHNSYDHREELERDLPMICKMDGSEYRWEVSFLE